MKPKSPHVRRLPWWAHGICNFAKKPNETSTTPLTRAQHLLDHRIPCETQYSTEQTLKQAAYTKSRSPLPDQYLKSVQFGPLGRTEVGTIGRSGTCVSVSAQPLLTSHPLSLGAHFDTDSLQLNTLAPETAPPWNSCPRQGAPMGDRTKTKNRASHGKSELEPTSLP